MTAEVLKITYKGQPLDTSPTAYGELQRSDDAIGDSVDERWTVEDSPLHGIRGHVGMIC